MIFTPPSPDSAKADKARAAAILAQCQDKPVRKVTTDWLRTKPGHKEAYGPESSKVARAKQASAAAVEEIKAVIRKHGPMNVGELIKASGLSDHRVRDAVVNNPTTFRTWKAQLEGAGGWCVRMVGMA